MGRMLTKDDIAKLAVAERLNLISELWDSLSPEDLPVPDSHRRALDEALADFQRDPNSAQSWEDVKDRFRSQK